MNSNDLIAQRSGLVAEAEALINSKGDSPDYSDDETKQLNFIQGEVKALSKKIDHATRSEWLATEKQSLKEPLPRVGEPAFHNKKSQDPAEEYRQTDRALRSWIARSVNAENRAAGERQGWNLFENTISVRTILTTTHPQWTLPTNIPGKLVEVEKAFGGVRALATVDTVDQMNNLTIPVADDTANKSVRLNEDALAPTLKPASGSVAFEFHKYTTGLIPFTIEMVKSTSFDLQAYIGRLSGTRKARGDNERFTVGTGANECFGVATRAADSGYAGGLSGDNLVKITTGNQPHNVQGSVFMVNSARYTDLRLMKVNGAYLWNPDFQTGTPGTLLGKRVVVNDDLPNTVVLYGDFSQYQIYDCMALELFRLNETFILNGRFGVVGHYILAANLMDPLAVRKIVIPA